MTARLPSGRPAAPPAGGPSGHGASWGRPRPRPRRPRASVAPRVVLPESARPTTVKAVCFDCGLVCDVRRVTDYEFDCYCPTHGLVQTVSYQHPRRPR